MAKPMTKAQLTGHLADKVGITKKQAAEFLDVLAKTAHRQARNGFTIPGGLLRYRRRRRTRRAN